MRDKMLNPSLYNDPVRMAHSCRMRAKSIGAIAASIRDPRAVDALKRQAAEWEELARSAEKRITAPAAPVQPTPR